MEQAHIVHRNSTKEGEGIKSDEALGLGLLLFSRLREGLSLLIRS
jgi:hypothetical protein